MIDASKIIQELKDRGVINEHQMEIPYLELGDKFSTREYAKHYSVTLSPDIHDNEQDFTNAIAAAISHIGSDFHLFTFFNSTHLDDGNWKVEFRGVSV